MSNSLGYGIGPMGWGDQTLSEADMIDLENRFYDKAAADMPVAYRSRPSNDLLPAIKKKWDDAMSLKGMGAGSACLLTLEEVAFGRQFDWLPQDIGSCVVSNTFRVWVQRAIAQICGRGDAEEFLGREEFSPNSIAFYGPQTYGMARKRVNMKGGDGLYCEPMAESLMKDGILDCNTPKLLEILSQENADKEKNFPEPIGKPSLYRAFGDWKYIESLRQFCDHRLLASVKVTSTDQLLSTLKEYKPSFMCSSVAIKQNGSHRDGFPIHVRNPNDRWMHNMAWSGFFYSSDGKLFFKLNNKSWGPKAVYNVPAEEVSNWFKMKLPTIMTLEEIDLPDSPPVIILE